MSFIKTPLNRAEKAILEAEYILIGAGAGLSAAAGIHYSGHDFEEAFADMIEKYRFTDLYSSSFYPFRTEEEKWAYWSRHIDFARFAPEGLPLYKKLLEMVQGKEYFVITTNVDGQFVKAGFDPDKVFEVQGDYGLMQCATACLMHWAPAKAHMHTLQISSAEAVNQALEGLVEAERSGASIWLGSHGGVAYKEDIDFRISYLTKVRELLESHPDATTFAAQLKSAYPALPGAEGVDALAQALCK